MKAVAYRDGAGRWHYTVEGVDRVGVPWLYSACGHCEYCLAALQAVCAQAEFGGYTRNGGLPTLHRRPQHVAHIPANLSSRGAAPLMIAQVSRGTRAEARPDPVGGGVRR
jgi:D-arabinose 1-dehydrogenase-like Zn-dependent alcohol dehydrogenase